MEAGRAQGPTLGRYHLAEALGGGPTGEVFRAKVFGVAGFERLFAIKRFYRALSDDPERMRLLGDAARKYQTIEHPRIARLHEFGLVDGQAFAAVELVPGVDLARLIAFTHGLGAPIPPGAALGIVAQVARAVAYAQGRGVLHLGIAPTNVVATADGDVKVMDFGFLKARLPQKPSEDGTLAARVPYLAPEQLEGAPVSPATDVFQLASLAQELLTGRRAFSGNNFAEVEARVRASTANPEALPAGIADVLSRAHARKPEDRFLNAGAFADALESAIRKTPQVGGRSDIGAAVRRAVQRTSEMEAQQFSGAMAFPMPAPPGEAANPPLPRAPSTISQVTPMPESVPQTSFEAPTRLGETPGQFVVGAPPRLPSQVNVAAMSRPSAPLVLPRAAPPSAPPPIPQAALDTSLPLPAPEPTRPGSLAGSEHTPSVPGLEAMIDEDISSEGVPEAEMPRVDTPAPLPPPPVSAPPPSTGPALGPPLSGTDMMGAMSGGAPAARAKKGRMTGWMVLAGVLLIGGGGGFIAWKSMVDDAPTPRPVVAEKKKPREKKAPAVVVDAGAAAAEGPSDAAPIAVAPKAAPDAAPAAKPEPTVTTAPADGVLRFETEPKGAMVYLDGSPKGKTPLQLPASGDRHKVAIVLLGHSMFRGEVDGSGVVKATLTPVSASTGEGRIKVRCKTQDRLYISVNGAPTGEFCPSERIYTPLGEITVETYDPVTDTVRSHQVVVKPSKGSQRVRLDD